MLKFIVLSSFICFILLVIKSPKKLHVISSQHVHLDQEPHRITSNYDDYIHNLRLSCLDKNFKKVYSKTKPCFHRLITLSFSLHLDNRLIESYGRMSKEISLNSGNTYKEYWPFVNYSIAITSSLHQYQDFFVKLNTANVYKNYDTMTLTINQEKSGNSDFFLSLLTSVQPVDQHLGFILQILLYYLTKKKKSVLNSNAIIQDNIHKVVRWIVKNFVASIVNEKDEITNKYSGKKYEKSEAQPKTDLTINIYRNECDEMKAHSMRLREKKYDLQIYLPVFVGNNSKENIFSSDILLKYQLLIRELLMCKFVYINPAIPMSVLVAYLILSTITINEAEVSKLRKCFILKYSYKDAADRLLWISHDVEKNPGPVGESFSEKLRPVTQNLYAKLLNIFEGKQTKKIPNNLCTKQADFYLYDHSAEKVYSCTYKSIEKEALIDILIACCQQKKFDITDLKEEVLAWTSCKFESLFQLHSISIASEKLSSHLLRTTQHAERVAIDKKMEEFGVKLNHTTFQNWLSNNPIVQNRKKADLCWEACRYIDSILCKYINKEYKRGEYYSTPPDWPPEYEKYQDPYNNKNGHDIRKFFKDLLRYCSNRDPIIGIPQEFKSYIKACEAWIKDTKKQEDLLEEYVLHHDVNIISENLSFLQTKSMLTDRDIGLLSLFSFQSYTTSNSRKRKNEDTETAERPTNATVPKVSFKEKQLKEKKEIWIKMTLNGEPIKVITHGYKPDFSKFKEVKYQDATKNASLEETKDEYQYENAMLNENLGDEPEEKTNNDTCDMCYEAPNCETGIPMIPELEGYHEISTVKPVTATDDESIHNPLPGSYARCPIENDFYMDINTADTYPLSEFHYDYNCSTPLITTSISSPDHAETEENSSNTASINNNLNYDYHDDNTFDNTIMNIDSTNDGMDYGILISTDTVTRGSSSSMNGQSCPDDEHLNSNQSMNFSEMDFWFADKTN